MPLVDGWYEYPGQSPAGWRVDIDFGSGWESVTEWVSGLVRQSGRRGPLDRFNASTLLIDVDNSERTFSPWYDGPFGRPRRNMPIRLLGRSLTGLETPRFTGYIDRITERATPAGYAPSTVAHSLVRVSATDGFKRLARANGLGTTPAGEGELSGARIHRILDAAGWDADARFVDDGEVTMAETDLSRYALDELHDTALAEGGVFFINAAGFAVFYDRASMTASLDPVIIFGTADSPGTVPYGELGIEDTDEAIINTVRVARAGGTQYTAVDSGGVTADGPQTFVRTDLPIETDPQAEALAAVLLSRAVNASFVVGPIIIQPQTGGYQSWASAVGLGVTNPVSVAHGDGTAGFTILTRIDAINDRIGPGVWETVYTVSALDEPDSYEVIGPPYDLTATSSYTSIVWEWSIPLHGFDSIFVSFDGSPWFELPGDTDTYYTGGLEPGTSHTISVRGRKGLVDTGAVSLTASTAEAPIGPDPDDDGGFDIPDPPEDCDAPKGWVWRVDELVVGVWTEIDSGLWAWGIDPNTDWHPPGITFVAGQWYQITFQLYCDGAPEGDPIIYSWQEPADWDEPCDFEPPPFPVAAVFALEVCAATSSIEDAVTDFPMVARELFAGATVGPFDTDVAALADAGFAPAPIASGYLADTLNLGVMAPPVLNPELTVGLWVNFDSEPLNTFPLIALGSNNEFALEAFADTVDVGTVRFQVTVKHPGGSGTTYTFDAAADHDDEVTISSGWHSVAVTWGWEGSDAKLRLYIDGAPTGTVHTLTGDWTVRAHDMLVVWGGEPNSRFAHPAGWDSVLSAEDIADIFTPPEAAGEYDDEVLADTPKAFWTFAAIDTVTLSAYDELVLDDTPKAFYTLAALDSIPAWDYDTPILAESNLWGYWPMDSKAGNIFDDRLGSKDFTLGTPANWTIHTGLLPNGDNMASTSGTTASNTGAGILPDLRDGTAWSIEFWMVMGAAGANYNILLYAGTTTTRFVWGIYVTPTETLDFIIYNTATGSYLNATTGVLTPGTLYHVVCTKKTGNEVHVWLNAVDVASDTSTSGTAQTPNAGDYMSVGTDNNGAQDMDTSYRLAKLAIYNRELSGATILAHYQSMLAP